MPRNRPLEVVRRVALAHHGYITTADARGAGIDPVRLRQMVARGTLTRIWRGVYRLPEAAPGPLDEYVAASLWPLHGTPGIISHETALDIHDLCEVNPGHIDITVPPTYRPGRRQAPSHYRLHRRELAGKAITDLSGLPIVTPAQAILDAIHTGLRDGLVRQAITRLRALEGLPHDTEEQIFTALAERRTRPSPDTAPDPP